MEMKDFNNSKSVKVDCSFCGNSIECPEELLATAKKHMCYECFITNEPSDEEIKDVHVDIPTEKMPEVVASGMADSMVNELFPNVWSEKKHELKELSKKDIALEMFGAGAYIALRSFLQQMKEREQKEKK